MNDCWLITYANDYVLSTYNMQSIASNWLKAGYRRETYIDPQWAYILVEQTT
jgi:hypothetical protein